MAEEARQLVILGVGNRLRGDDAVGCIVCDELCREGHDRNSPGGFGSCPGPSSNRNSPPRPRDVKENGDCPAPSPTQTLGGIVPGLPQSEGAGSLAVLGDCSLPDGVFVLDCGNTPENYLQPVADKMPSRILIIDCCNYGAKPGESRLFSRDEIEQLSYGLLSTHTLPLTLTVEMLSLETHATIELLGVQPERIEFGEDLSEPVRLALPALVEFVRSWARAGTQTG